MTKFNGFQLLLIAKKSSVFVVAGFLDSPLFFLSSVKVRLNG